MPHEGGLVKLSKLSMGISGRQREEPGRIRTLKGQGKSRLRVALIYLTDESSSLSAPSTRVVARLLSGSDRRHAGAGRFVGSLTTTSDVTDDDGGAVVVTDDRIPGLAATMVVLGLPKSCPGRSQIDGP
jgi:hypothetical protein